MPISIIPVYLDIYNFPPLSHFPQHHPLNPSQQTHKHHSLSSPPQTGKTRSLQILRRTQDHSKKESEEVAADTIRERFSLSSISFQLPLLPELCASRSPSALQLLLPPLSSSAPPSPPSISSRCSMYVSVCEPAELPVCLHVRRSALLDLPHLDLDHIKRRGAFLKCPSEKEFSQPLTYPCSPFESSHSCIPVTKLLEAF